MRKTSVYLSDEDRERLQRLAEREGVSQATVLREAIAAYDAHRPDRAFAMSGVVESYDRPIRDLTEAELLGGFGDEADRRPLQLRPGEDVAAGQDTKPPKRGSSSRRE